MKTLILVVMALLMVGCCGCGRRISLGLSGVRPAEEYDAVRHAACHTAGLPGPFAIRYGSHGEAHFYCVSPNGTMTPVIDPENDVLVP
jgi:hypothetical protein